MARLVESIGYNNRSDSDAAAIFQFLRKWLYSNYHEVRVIGMNIANIGESAGASKRLEMKHDLATFPGSTDLTIDLKVALAVAHYTITPALASALMNGTSTGGIEVKSRDGIKIACAKLIKKFDGTDKLTYRDFSKYLTFSGVDVDTPIVHVTDQQAELEISIYFQDINGIQGELQNQMNCDHVFGSSVVRLPISAMTLQGIQISFDTNHRQGDFHEHSLTITGDSEDSRVASIKKRLADKLAETIKIWDT